MAADPGRPIVGAQDHRHGVPADHAPDAQLHLLVAGEARLLLGRDRVDVARRGQRRQADVVLARALEQRVEDELGPRAPLVLDDGVERLDPVRRLGRVAVGKLALEVAELVEHLDRHLTGVAVSADRRGSRHRAGPVLDHVGIRRAASPYPSAVADQSALGLGIDVGGTGVKAALVDLATGELVSTRVRVNTPQPSTPDAVAETIAARRRQQSPSEHAIPDGIPVGCGLPGVVKSGVVMTAANIDKGVDRRVGRRADRQRRSAGASW